MKLLMRIGWWKFESIDISYYVRVVLLENYNSFLLLEKSAYYNQMNEQIASATVEESQLVLFTALSHLKIIQRVNFSLKKMSYGKLYFPYDVLYFGWVYITYPDTVFFLMWFESFIANFLRNIFISCCKTLKILINEIKLRK